MVASAAISFPSDVTPILTLVCDPGAGPVASNTSVRDITIFTGRLPALRDKAAAIGSK